MGDAAIEVIDVCKTFGSSLAVKDVTFTVGQGEFFTFLGPSGCGKTTLLRMIAGFESPSAGKILISGQSVVKVPPHKRPVNMVFQSYALFPHMTVIENICFGLRSAGKLPKSETLERAKRALALVRLEPLAARLPSELSGGQQQRVALARAIVNEPAVLLLDEPLSALDPQIRENMQGELARLQRELNMTFIMVTHDQMEALALSHRIAVFCQGNLEQVGRPEEVYAAPQTKFVADFIGQSNLIPCTYSQSTQGVHQLDFQSGTRFSAQSAADIAVCAGDPCVLCVKPQSMRIYSEDDWNFLTDLPKNFMRGTITHANYRGGSTEYLVLVNNLHLRVETGQSSVGLGLGQPVVLSFPVEGSWLLADPSPAPVPQTIGAATTQLA